METEWKILGFHLMHDEGKPEISLLLYQQTTLQNRKKNPIKIKSYDIKQNHNGWWPINNN